MVIVIFKLQAILKADGSTLMNHFMIRIFALRIASTRKGPFPFFGHIQFVMLMLMRFLPIWFHGGREKLAKVG